MREDAHTIIAVVVAALRSPTASSPCRSATFSPDCSHADGTPSNSMRHAAACFSPHSPSHFSDECYYCWDLLICHNGRHRGKWRAEKEATDGIPTRRMLKRIFFLAKTWMLYFIFGTAKKKQCAFSRSAIGIDRFFLLLNFLASYLTLMSSQACLFSISARFFFIKFIHKNFIIST